MVKTPKLKLNLKALNLSKINLRKINWNTIMAVMAYLHVLVLIPVIFGRKSEFVQFHTKQGIALLFAWIVLAYSLRLPFLFWIIAIYIIVSIVYGLISVVRGLEKPLLLFKKYLG